MNPSKNDVVGDKTKMYFSAYDLKFSEKVSRKDLMSWVTLIKTQKESVIDLQFFNNNSLFSTKHLESAVWHAYKSIQGNYSISNSISVEFLLYASGQRQISKALDYFGLGDFASKVSLVIFHLQEFSLKEIQNKLERSFDNVKVSDIDFSITDEKLETLQKLFDFELGEKVPTKKSLERFEKYILSCISNLVFEG